MTLEDTTVVAVAFAEVSWATVAGIVPVVVPVEELQKKKYDMIIIALLDLKYCNSHSSVLKLRKFTLWQKIRETKRFTKAKEITK